MERTMKVSKYFEVERSDEKKFKLINSIINEKFEPSQWKSATHILVHSELHKNLKAKCIQYLLNSLDLSNACSLLEVSKMVSAPLLYQRCLEVCIEAAFAILDSEDFDQIDSSTVITIISQPNLNANETDILYALWIRATIDCCRQELDPDYENILKNFQVYSVYIHFEGVDERRLNEYNNDKLSKFYQSVKNKGSKLSFLSDFPKRKYRKPVNLDPRLFCGYIAGGTDLFVQIKEEPFAVKFAVLESVYLIELTCSCASKADTIQGGLKLILFKTGNRVMHEEKNMIFQRKNVNEQQVRLYEHHFTLQNAIKLCPQKEYSIVFEPSSHQLLWPVITKFDELGPISFLSSEIVCLVGIKLVRSSYLNNYSDLNIK